MRRALTMAMFSGAFLTSVFATTAFAQALEGIPARHREALGGFAAFANFLQRHPGLKTELEAHPERINEPGFVEKHRALKEFYRAHPEVLSEMKQDAGDFMRREKAMATYGTAFRNFHSYLRTHPGVEDQLEKNPALAGDARFLNQHPNLRGYLRSHPEVAWEMEHDSRHFFAREHAMLEGQDARQRKQSVHRVPAASAPQFQEHFSKKK